MGQLQWSASIPTHLEQSDQTPDEDQGGKQAVGSDLLHVNRDGKLDGDVCVALSRVQKSVLATHS
jgi:hypothetical protein